MKKLVLLLCAYVLSFQTYAQDSKPALLDAQTVSKLDVSGKWIGKRYQYSWDRQSIVETFEYEFELKQSGNSITGYSTIISSQGDYAEILLDGSIMDNTFYFAEKAVKDAVRPEGKVWCYKMGGLKFKMEGEKLQMLGETSSLMEGSNYPCSGGVTLLTKVDNSVNVPVINPTTNSSVVTDFSASVYPNPFSESTNISYRLIGDSKVNVEVYDLSGSLVKRLLDANQKSGFYTLNFKPQSAKSGIYIVRLQAGNEVYTQQLVQFQ